jgi:hypothetical protein
MRECWAAALGGCSEKMSKEHTVTEGVFLDEEVFVQGLNWCKTNPKRVGLGNVTRKILCKTHNSL